MEDDGLDERESEEKPAITDTQRLDWIEATGRCIECSENIAGNIERFTIGATREAIDIEIRTESKIKRNRK